jgi:hypothetical protein
MCSTGLWGPGVVQGYIRTGGVQGNRSDGVVRGKYTATGDVKWYCGGANVYG